MGVKEKLFFTWIVFSILIMAIVIYFFNTAFPLFTFIWLLVALIIVLIKRDANIVGMKELSSKELVKVTFINLLVSLSIIFIFEQLTHTYEKLIEIALQGSKPDVTFVWLTIFDSPLGFIVMFIFSGLVTIFAEELFFRGMLLQTFKRSINYKAAVLLQAFLFSLPHFILALFMEFTQGFVLLFVYGFIVYGLIGGWAANRTNTIWPSLITATVNNLVLIILYF